MPHVLSADGTRIAYQTLGSGPPLIVVDGALCSRSFGPSPQIAAAFSHAFTVVTHDRRGRGESADTAAYQTAREVEDVASLLAAVGGKAALLGLSSGAALALEAAASGLPVTRVAAYEPPFVEAPSSTEGQGHLARLQQRLASGDRGGAVKYFMGPMVGAPAAMVFFMQLMPWVWRKLKAVAHTLPYDAAVMGDFTVPSARLAAVRAPALIMHGSKTDPRLQRAAHAVAAAVPGARHEVLPGQTHNVNPRALAAASLAFLSAP
jgi:pimeloyl-ACP methyl ester carboxylesterase